MIQIAPSILSADFAHLAEQVNMIEAAGADLLHIDVMDGHFVPNITIGPAVIHSLRRDCRLHFDVHLMIEKPERFISDFAAAGADHLTVHLEATSHLHRVVQQIKDLGLTAGIALNPATPLSGLKYILDDLDRVLLMTVNPGFGGQKFIPAVLSKIAELQRELAMREPSCSIEVDGGINATTAQAVTKAGARILIAGAAIFADPDPAQALQAIRRAGEEGEGKEK
ncbi:MAG: ribulose-phosphate 3-epimerase [Desulfitobacteriaceae bacterium]